MHHVSAKTFGNIKIHSPRIHLHEGNPHHTKSHHDDLLSLSFRPWIFGRIFLRMMAIHRHSASLQAWRRICPRHGGVCSLQLIKRVLGNKEEHQHLAIKLTLRIREGKGTENSIDHSRGTRDQERLHEHTHLKQQRYEASHSTGSAHVSRAHSATMAHIGHLPCIPGEDESGSSRCHPLLVGEA